MKDCMAAKAAAPPPPSPPAQKTATAKNDVDIYKGPGGKFGTIKCQGHRCVMRDQTTAPVLEYHPDGWCKLKGVADGADGWVAADHLSGCP
jgi:hypothetical protein